MHTVKLEQVVLQACTMDLCGVSVSIGRHKWLVLQCGMFAYLGVSLRLLGRI